MDVNSMDVQNESDNRNEILRMNNRQLADTLSKTQQINTCLQNSLHKMHEDLFESEAERRMLNNKLLDMQSNIVGLTSLLGKLAQDNQKLVKLCASIKDTTNAAEFAYKELKSLALGNNQDEKETDTLENTPSQNEIPLGSTSHSSCESSTQTSPENVYVNSNLNRFQFQPNPEENIATFKEVQNKTNDGDKEAAEQGEITPIKKTDKKYIYTIGQTPNSNEKIKNVIRNYKEKRNNSSTKVSEKETNLAGMAKVTHTEMRQPNTTVKQETKYKFTKFLLSRRNLFQDSMVKDKENCCPDNNEPNDQIASREKEVVQSKSKNEAINISNIDCHESLIGDDAFNISTFTFAGDLDEINNGDDSEDMHNNSILNTTIVGDTSIKERTRSSDRDVSARKTKKYSPGRLSFSPNDIPRRSVRIAKKTDNQTP